MQQARPLELRSEARENVVKVRLGKSLPSAAAPFERKATAVVLRILRKQRAKAMREIDIE